MTLTTYKDYQELFSGCIAYWGLRGDLIPIIGTNIGSPANSPVLTHDRFGVANKAYSFVSASSQYITFGNPAASTRTIVMWIKLTTASGGIAKLNVNHTRIMVSNGDVSIHGYMEGTPAFYVDGNLSSILDTSWRMLTMTISGTALTINSFTSGYTQDGYLNGDLGEILFFSTQLTINQIKALYNVMRLKPLYPVIPGIRGVE